MRKRVEHYKRDHWFSFALGIQNPYERDHWEKPYCQLHIAAFGHSWWIKIPELFKPRTKWIDLSKESWATVGKDGRKGYTEQIRRDYGFSFDKEAIHIHYGIQPGSWSSRDPKNSDHTKVFWWPWRLEIVRHDLLLPNGDVYWRNTFPRKGKKHLHWYEVFSQDTKSDVTTEVAQFVDLEHFTKDQGHKQVARVRLTGEEREWRPKWTSWLPIFRHVSRVVDCNSDVELGTKAGSWKGGMMGWSCDWREDESMEDAFRRWYKSWNGV